VKKAEKWSEIEVEVDPERLWQTMVDQHRVHLTSKVAAIDKLDARSQLQSLRQRGFESIIYYKQ
jgi:predicted xylose isomerase-like sugar epimerase